jgi:hypothetical protein
MGSDKDEWRDSDPLANKDGCKRLLPDKAFKWRRFKVSATQKSLYIICLSISRDSLQQYLDGSKQQVRGSIMIVSR